MSMPMEVKLASTTDVIELMNVNQENTNLVQKLI